MNSVGWEQDVICIFSVVKHKLTLSETSIFSTLPPISTHYEFKRCKVL